MATAVTTFAFATTLQSWSSIAALASGETNGLDTVNGNPADALFGKLVGKTKATTAGAGMKLSQTLTAWGVPTNGIVTAVSVALDKKCVTAPGSAIGSGSFNTKLNLNAGASINTGPTQTLSTTADSVWTTLGTGSNAALSGLSDSTLSHQLEVDILYTLSTTSSALTSTTWQIDWDNVVVTVTYTLPVILLVQKGTGTNNASVSGAIVGNMLIVVGTGAAGDTLSVSDGTNSYTLTTVIAGANRQIAVWAAPIAISSFAVSLSGASAGKSIAYAEYETTNVGETLNVDQLTSGTSATSPLTLTTSNTVNAEEDDLFATLLFNWATNPIPTGYTLINSGSPDVSTNVFFCEKHVFSTGAQSGSQTATFSGTGEIDGVLLTLRSVASPVAHEKFIPQAVNRSNTY